MKCESLLNEMERIHNLGWITSKRLGSEGQVLTCNAPNCGGYTGKGRVETIQTRIS